MASMFVMGIDFGNDSSYIAIPRAGGIETITNDYSLRATPSCIAFGNKNRVLGVAAKNQLVSNMKNTTFNFKRLLGKQFDDPSMAHELKYLPFQVTKDKDGNIGVRVNYLNEEHVFSIQQITAMFFTKLKETAESALKCEVNQCVISVPYFFDNSERQALLEAADIAGLKVLRIFNETAATALTYGIYKQDLPDPDDVPRHVAFVDCGHTSLQVSICSFNKGKLKVVAAAADSQLGGRDIDMALAEYFSDDFTKRYNIKPRENARAFIRLLAEVEKIKKQMSANSTKLPLNIECFMDDKDVHGEMKRSDMEQLCADLFNRAEITMQKCLVESQLKKEDIHSVEIVGGSSRIPAIKLLIEKIFGKVPSTTLNQDEAVAKGCALQCAMLCPAILVKEFSITDIQNYPIKVVYEPGDAEEGHIDVFPRNHPIPFSKILTFHRKSPFTINAVYSENNKFIGQFHIKDVKPDAQGRSQKVKVKARINMNGIFSIVSASLTERQPVEPDTGVEPMEVSPTATTDGKEPARQDQQQPVDDKAMQVDADVKEDPKETKKKKATVKSIDLPVVAEIFGSYSPTEIATYVEKELSMISSDRQERDRVDARNALEEYMYELRGKLSSSEELASFIPEIDRKKLCKQLDELETWLYEEGEECQRQVYADKLNALKDTGEPIKKRKIEFETQPPLFEDFGSVLQLTQKVIEQYKAGDDKYSHIEQSEIGKVQESTENAWKWVEETRSKFSSCSPYQDPPVSAERILKEKNNFEKAVNQVFSKPKPVQPVPPEPQASETSDQKKEGTGEREETLINGNTSNA